MKTVDKWRIVVVVGAGRVVGKLLCVSQDHSLRANTCFIAAAPQFCLNVARYADVCLEIPGEMAELHKCAANATAIYVAVPPDQTIWCLRELGTLEQLCVVEKPPCRADQIAEMTTFCGGSVRAVDHWLFDAVLKHWPEQLTAARQRFGRLLCVNIELGERNRIDSFNRAAFTGAGGVWPEYGYHGWNVLKTRLLPGLTATPVLFFLAAHVDAPPDLFTFGAAVALLDNVPAALADDGHALVTLSAGKGMPMDQSLFSFVFETGVLQYHHRRGEIATCDIAGSRRVEIVKTPSSHRAVFEALATGAPNAFQPLDDAIDTVREMELLAQNPIKIPARYTRHPLPFWPGDGILAASAHATLRDWIRNVRFLKQPAIQRFVVSF